ncbi:hypothetical protein [Agrobacterium tumefaciens]|uniref:hypothetical protein n=1 Tax=Agrobacterium tumefaciens TaxID=358 RepID=UPI000459B48A|nr:hypothetical protein [Agrobacterium tumefaciens]CDN95929.1 hypothetical protein BN949_05101 [Agrobacterium tumefaciens]
MTDAISKLTQLLDDYVDERIAESSSKRAPELDRIAEQKARQFIAALLQELRAPNGKQ